MTLRKRLSGTHRSSSSSSLVLSTDMAYVWVVLISLVGAFSSFMIYRRHYVEISQLMVVSVDQLNVNVQLQPPPPQQQQPQAEKQHQQQFTTTGPQSSHGNDDDDGNESRQPSDVIRSLGDSSSSHDNKDPIVYFLNQTQVTHKDSFSASWLQSKQDFLDMDMKAVKICEDAAFKAWNTRKDKLRMTMDYLNFSVEHLSKWWKLLDFYASENVYTSIMTKLQQYIQRGAVDCPQPVHNPPILQATLVTIAFQPYSAPQGESLIAQQRAHNLTVTSLAATIESIRRAEMGRVVVVGSESSHRAVAQESFDYLKQHLKLPPQSATTTELNGTNVVTQIGHLELGFVQLTPEHSKTKLVERNMPKGALVGAREAFLLATQDPATLTDQDKETMEKWLGTKQSPSFWNYLYLTEPDSILTTRSSALAQIKEEIDVRGGIIAPFRLQPIPHESDLKGYAQKHRFLPAEDFEVQELDHYDNPTGSHDVCCDEYAGHDHRPGKSDFAPCGHKKWFSCGFEQKIPTEDPHRRLKPYKLFRLTRGTGMVTIAGNLFARRCLPAHNAVCKPPYVD